MTRRQYRRKTRPSTRRPKRSRRSRNYRRRRLANRKFWGNSMKSTVLPLKFNFTTRYVELNKLITATPGSMGTWIWSANGLYDPDISGTGHQPIGFDQLIQFYDHYTVIASKIKVYVQNISQQHPVVVALYLSDDVNPATNNIGTVLENGAVKWRRLERQGSDGTFMSNDRSHCCLTKACSIKRFMGRPNILSEDDLRGSISSNPDEGVFYKVILQGVDGSADAVSCQITVQIDYVAIMTEPKLVQAS